MAKSADTYLLWCECWPGSHIDVDVQWPSATVCGETLSPNRWALLFRDVQDATEHQHVCSLPHKAADAFTPACHDGDHVCACGTHWGWAAGGKMQVNGVAPEPGSYDTGRQCTWLEWLHESIGWDEIIRYGQEDEGDDVAFCLRYGIAPGQPFLLLFHDYTNTTHRTEEGTDYDEEWAVSVMMVEPWTPERVLRAWEEWLAEGAVEPREDWVDSFASQLR